ncbi:MAG: hypothetical protein FWG98_08745 [Candidatus Cloacimonetes bacterium]|nr:hypothetical protein [Candidatus Cloacimonadota bacterium]
MKKTIFYVLIVSLLLAGFLACSDKKTKPKDEDINPNLFVGTWTNERHSVETFIIRSNMTFTYDIVGNPGGTIYVHGTYTLDFGLNRQATFKETDTGTTFGLVTDGVTFYYGGHLYTKQ